MGRRIREFLCLSSWINFVGEHLFFRVSFVHSIHRVRGQIRVSYDSARLCYAIEHIAYILPLDPCGGPKLTTSTRYRSCDSSFRLANFTLDYIGKNWASEIDFVVCTSASLL